MRVESREVEARPNGLRIGKAIRAPGAHPSSSPMPLTGILFLVAAVLGPACIAVGVSTGNPLLLVAGVAVAIVLIALLLLGMVF
jgi:predicted transporter